MSRRSLLDRLSQFLESPTPLELPSSFVPGRSSGLEALVEAGSISRLDVQRFLEHEMPSAAAGSDGHSWEPAPVPGVSDKLHRAVGEERRFASTAPHDVHDVDRLFWQFGSDFTLTAIVPQEGTVHDATIIEDRDHEVMQTILDKMGGDSEQIEVVNSYDLNDEVDDAEEAPIIRLLNHVFLQAIKDRASDIHIEAEESVTRVRYRIDGELREVMHPPKRFHNAIVSRVKIMSDLDIAEKRSPQDGRMKLRVGRGSIDIRVSTLPSVYGEKVVMRVLTESNLALSLDQLGFTDDQIKRYQSCVTRPYGIVLVTGPTGSGKTTTLYSTLRFLNSKAKNIITIEDPVEYQMENVNQIQVNRKAGIDFASGLKSILRQDPDIIMVGEMRDEETASIAVKAALTGHLVLSTLHTNDAPGTYERLQDMKVPPYLLASAITGVVAQRLVRRNCPRCSESYTPDPETLRLLGVQPSDEHDFQRGTGCDHCSQTGYRGRTAIYEILTPTQELKKRILAGTLQEGTEIPGFPRMIDHGRELALRGETTCDEVLKVARMQDATIA